MELEGTPATAHNRIDACIARGGVAVAVALHKDWVKIVGLHVTLTGFRPETIRPSLASRVERDASEVADTSTRAGFCVDVTEQAEQEGASS